ncbi:hypothetical protein TREMEDRAFT_63310 [Tremella mesenterica DSM 1558]|uniref:uncharacterized protein n=1 Tax=Tremella mesenterica (strain ATCC 24925 / CBS 8224 / DSM 1558 / NBRC 9311 / NRRL Y-6157 / RJB 2259-6 / UBC 559-6) TaxID=578456 RepID=UPI0003F49B6F|nr:uncharacterized protein TREMEDRAFT_63310 [Tremella mesenterica DSM 1558]EIW68843.1 hypothetical protein TREMEDRAFT_63310 [Tremella mesenterica DSM 1558]
MGSIIRANVSFVLDFNQGLIAMSASLPSTGLNESDRSTRKSDLDTVLKQAKSIALFSEKYERGSFPGTTQNLQDRFKQAIENEIPTKSGMKIEFRDALPGFTTLVEAENTKARQQLCRTIKICLSIIRTSEGKFDFTVGIPTQDDQETNEWIEKYRSVFECSMACPPHTSGREVLNSLVREEKVASFLCSRATMIWQQALLENGIYAKVIVQLLMNDSVSSWSLTPVDIEAVTSPEDWTGFFRLKVMCVPVLSLMGPSLLVVIMRAVQEAGVQEFEINECLKSSNDICMNGAL